MKTDFIEIFQSIRAVLQPYTTTGFETSVNSETDFELYTINEVMAYQKNKKCTLRGLKF